MKKIMSSYKDKLFEDKIDSMNQMDTIELYSVCNFYNNYIGTKFIIMFLFMTSGTILLVLGLFLISLTSFQFKDIGTLSLCISFIFFVMILYTIFTILSKVKRANKKVEKIIERGGSKK